MSNVQVIREGVLYQIVVFYTLPGLSPTRVDNVTGYQYADDRLVIEHDRAERTDIMTGNIRMVHITIQ